MTPATINALVIRYERIISVRTSATMSASCLVAPAFSPNALAHILQSLRTDTLSFLIIVNDFFFRRRHKRNTEYWILIRYEHDEKHRLELGQHRHLEH